MSKRLTMKAVQDAIDAKGYKLEFVNGNGYFYVVGEDADRATSASILVFRLNHIDLDDWMSRIDEIVAESRARSSEYDPSVFTMKITSAGN